MDHLLVKTNDSNTDLLILKWNEIWFDRIFFKLLNILLFILKFFSFWVKLGCNHSSKKKKNLGVIYNHHYIFYMMSVS